MSKELLFCGSKQLGDLVLLSQVAVQLNDDIDVDVGYVSSSSSDQLVGILDIGSSRFTKVPQDISIPNTEMRGYRITRLYEAVSHVCRMLKYSRFLVCDVDSVRFLPRIAQHRLKYLTHEEPKSDVPFVRYYTQILEGLGYTIYPDRRISYSIPEESQERVGAWLHQHASRSDGNYTCMNLSTRLTKKDWPLDRFERLAYQLVERGEDVFVLNPPCGVDLSFYPQLKRRLMCGKDGGLPQLVDSCALIQRAHRYIGPDTGLTHIAASMNVPIVALYTNEFRGYWDPVGNGPVRILSTPEMSQISVEDVLQCIE